MCKGITMSPSIFHTCVSAHCFCAVSRLWWIIMAVWTLLVLAAPAASLTLSRRGNITWYMYNKNIVIHVYTVSNTCTCTCVHVHVHAHMYMWLTFHSTSCQVSFCRRVPWAEIVEKRVWQALLRTADLSSTQSSERCLGRGRGVWVCHVYVVWVRERERESLTWKATSKLSQTQTGQSLVSSWQTQYADWSDWIYSIGTSRIPDCLAVWFYFGRDSQPCSTEGRKL